MYVRELRKFPEESIFMQVTVDEKGYIQVLPEYEEQYDKIFGNLELIKYELEYRAVDKIIWAKDYLGYIEYAYLSLYDECIFDENLNDENKVCEKYGLTDARAVYYAFKKIGRIRYDDDFISLKEALLNRSNKFNK